jgi:hypothetical protein
MMTGSFLGLRVGLSEEIDRWKTHELEQWDPRWI